ncbi:hypothetical protein G4G28_18960 [Massilia sp. Dwa41.01b]|uniref:hypothetical protein n=1 Tax=Massilia sp. Dwa41.01b TaxID=2709302 RepID=UPI0016049361|nr:hypothetical protein [Massilia sp. Dwa41.01b]QNA90053.1 hypothetical protein G4G28_18960 [Massilia sp. Dwa41.01b]
MPVRYATGSRCGVRSGRRRRARTTAASQASGVAPSPRCPADVRVTRDLAYGGDPAERFDVYAPRAGSSGASVIFMVHSGGWKHGDKGVAA